MNRSIYQKHRILSIVGILITVLVMVMISPSVVVYAGDINGNEASVIAVASGTFTYEGKTYKAYSSYVNELYGYMAQDGVDLTADQASRAIGYIYANVATGVSSGYVYLVEEPEEDNTDLDEIIPEMEERGELDEYQNNMGYGSGNGKKDTPSVEASEEAKAASDKEIDDMFGKISEDHAEKEAYQTKPVASATDASVVMTDKDIIITTDETEHVISVNNRIIPGFFSTLLIIIGAVILGIDVLIGIVLFVSGCMRLSSKDRRKSRKGHHTRRRIRRICRNTLTVTSSIAVVLVLLIISLSIGIFNNNHIVQNIQNSGYFRFAYTEYLTEYSETDNSDTPVGYEDFLVEEKKALDKMDSSPLTKSISIAPYMKRLQNDMRECVIISSILLAIAMIVSIFENIFMDLRRDRGVKSVAISAIIGTVVVFTFAIILAMSHLETRVFIEPDYLYSFIVDHLAWIIRIMMVVSTFSAVIGMSLVGLYRSMRKEKD